MCGLSHMFLENDYAHMSLSCFLPKFHTRSLGINHITHYATIHLNMEQLVEKEEKTYSYHSIHTRCYVHECPSQKKTHAQNCDMKC